VLVPNRDVRVLNMTIGEGMKFIISGGAVSPVWPPTEATVIPTVNTTTSSESEAKPTP
jgi:uncharacterized membrane protein